MRQSWIIGKGSDCDLALDQPTVSTRHCRLSVDGDGAGYLLEDLQSRNGTYVNQTMVTAPVRVTRGDAITLGQTLPFPWPKDALLPGARVVTIGRDADNDVVLELPIVSGRHARLIREGREPAFFLEDLGSSNGTALGSLDAKIQLARLRAGDTVYLGTHAVPASVLLARFEPAPLPPVSVGERLDEPGRVAIPATAEVGTVPAFAHEEPSPSVPLAVPGFALRPDWRLGALAAQVVVMLAIVAGVSWWGSRASTISCLSVVAVWAGLAQGVFAGTAVRGRMNGVLWIGGLAGLCVLESGIAWGVAAIGAGMRMPVLPALLLLGMTAIVGLFGGLLISTLSARPASAWAAMVPILLALWLLGGERWPVSRMPSLARAASSVLPTRWTFEALLLFEADRAPAGAASEGGKGDLAEDFFPAETARMGPRAAAIALQAMLVGLAVAFAFIGSIPRRVPAP